MKSIKNLIVPAIILVVLAICAIVIWAVDKFRSNEPVESSGGMIDVVYFNQTDISKLTLTGRDNGHSTVVLCSLDSSGSVYYSYQGDDYDPADSYSQTKLSAFVSQLSSFNAYKIVSSSGNYSDYGLDKPAYTLTIDSVTGTSTTIYLGNTSPDGKYCYIYIDGSSDIYSVSSIKLICADVSAVDFLDSRALNISYSDLKTVHFDRRSDGLSIDANVLQSGSDAVSFDIFKPYSHPASGYFYNMIDSIVKLEITEYIEISGNEELKQYGLDNPDFHFVFTMNNGDKTELYFSKKIGGFYYGYVVGMDNYFVISEYQLDGMEMKETVLIDPYICYYYVKDISSITGTYGDKKFIFELNVPSGKSITDNDSTVRLDGRNAKISDSYGRSYCSILYESIACINIGGIDVDADVNTATGPVLSLIFLDKNYVTTTYDFYLRDNDSFYVLVNGEYTGFYVYSREIFNDSGTDTYSYGYWRAYELLNEAISGNINGIYDLPKEV